MGGRTPLIAPGADCTMVSERGQADRGIGRGPGGPPPNSAVSYVQKILADFCPRPRCPSRKEQDMQRKWIISMVPTLVLGLINGPAILGADKKKPADAGS